MLSSTVPSPTDWLTWPGWVFIGTCAGVLSLLTLLAAAYRWWLSSRSYPPVIFEVEAPYSLNSTQGVVAYRVRITNAGRATAHLRSMYLLGATVIDEVTSPQIRWLVRSADYFEFDVESPNIDVAWVLIVSSTFEDNRLLRAAWYPIRPGTELSQKAASSYVRTKRRRGVAGAWDRRHPRTVGPNNAAHSFITMPKRKIQDVPTNVLAEVNSYQMAQLRRLGTSQVGNPNEWLRPENAKSEQ